MYEALSLESNRFGFDECLTIAHPGQEDAKGNRQGQLSLTSSTAHAKEILKTVPIGVQFRFVGFSFGCYVAAEVATDLTFSRRCEKIVLWGPVPLSVSWAVFIRGEGREHVGIDTDIIEDSHYFADLVPLEDSLPRIAVNTLVGVGSEDDYVVPGFLDYLSQLCERNHRKISTQVVSGCEHTVFPTQAGYPRYLDSILG